MGRQPILDAQQKIIGYELLFRSNSTDNAARIEDDFSAGAQVLINTLSNMGTEWLMGDKLAFLNVTEAMLTSEFMELLPAKRIVLEIKGEIAPSPALIERLQALKELGFQFALHSAQINSDNEPLIKLASYVKVDLLQAPLDRLGDIAAKLKQFQLKIIAEKVETLAAFKRCKECKFDFFQGYYFAHPEILTAKVINPAQALVLDVLNKVRNNADIAEIEKGFKRDVALSFKLLRYINSVGFGLSCEIQSIRHALSILGYQQLYRWLTLLIVTSNEGATPPALMKTAITRGRLTELLGQDMVDRSERDNLFIVGIFSLLDAMLEMPMDQVLEKLTLPENIADALLNRDGIYGPFLSLSEACESADMARIDELATALTLEPAKVNEAHLQALAWVEELGV
ncbi:MAG: diguanylate phosphodiesterase [Betaproteobacteria bacterium RBG_16_58_11]|nr:MAG: diguanylate phosphodiesterase [Betaproteobacteria bacterium RBG_16_58_11]